ncbi:hypothetical protein PHET_04063 [Paragonimus heterotremus]|uniref:VWFA domain-containing protein n=1 Tax=Paragonimus heterotremus TaxID=100268 RepID=A0A8J4TJD5_9TREM|nr:hypothetical protein PHET_04063 [Paragonimus heterotremus]
MTEFGLKPLNPLDEGFRLLNVVVSCDITHLVANTCAKLTYKNDTSFAQNATFMWPGWYPPIQTFEANDGTTKTRTYFTSCNGNPILDHAPMKSGIREPSADFQSSWIVHPSNLIQFDLGAIDTQASIVITLMYVNTLDVNVVTADKKPSHTSHFDVSYTLLNAITPDNRSPDSYTDDTKARSKLEPMTSHTYTFSFEAYVKMPATIEAVLSTTDQYSVQFLTANHRSAHIVLTSSFQPDHELHMNIHLGKSDRLFAFAEQACDVTEVQSIPSIDCLFLCFVPDCQGFTSKKDMQKELVLLIDRSKEVCESRMRYFAEAFALFLKSLQPGCRFQVIGYGNRFETLFSSGPTEYNLASVDRALHYHEQLRSDMGSCNLLPALEYALDIDTSSSTWQRQIIVLSGGDFGDLSKLYGLLTRNMYKANISFLSVGASTELSKLSGIFRASHSQAVLVDEESRLGEAILSVMHEAFLPRLEIIEIKYQLRNSDGQIPPVYLFPQSLTSVNYGDYLMQLAMFPKDTVKTAQGQIIVTYVAGNQKETLSLNTKNIVLSNARKELKNSCFLHQLALQYGLSTESFANPADAHKNSPFKFEPVWICMRSKNNENDKNDDFILPKTNKKLNQSRKPARKNVGCFPNCQQRKSKARKVEKRKTIEAINSAPANAQKGQAAKADILNKLASLQQTDGSWNLTEDIADLLEIPLELLEKKMPTTKFREPKKTWATALVIAQLDLYHKTHPSASVMCEKGIQWLSSQQFITANDEMSNAHVVRDAKLLLINHCLDFHIAK